MIKINLIDQKNRMQLPVVLGIDFQDVNFGGVILSIIFMLILSNTIGFYTSGALEDINKLVSTKQQELAKLNKEIQTKSQYEKAIDEMKQTEKSLTRRLEIVKKIIKSKKNPMKVLHYISKNIPKEVWINEIALKDDKLTILGESSSYQSIGVFLESLKSSIYFQTEMPVLKSSKTINNKELGVRTEQFDITGEIVRFE